MTAYYNEHDPFCAAWLRNLIAAGHIAPGVVDERDIRDVAPASLAAYRQCHFFAGLGLWSLALRWAGVSDDEPVWTGSCPCQPYSAAGAGKGDADERHLWPHWFHLLSIHRPPVVYGEQVASPAGLGWFDLVSADLEGSGYAVGANDLCAASVGAPHIRQRLWFVAERLGESDSGGRQEGRQGAEATRHGRALVAGGSVRRLVHGVEPGLEGHAGNGDVEAGRQIEAGSVATAGGAGGLADADGEHQGPAGRHEARAGDLVGRGQDSRPGPPDGFWRDADWLHCRDGKWRPVEPGTFPLVDGYPQRVGCLRAAGNAICPQVAAEFIRAHRECRQ